MTFREQRLWLAWLDLQWEHPTADQYYLAQIALELVRGNVRNPGRFKLKDFILKFEPPRPAGARPEWDLAMTKARWLGQMTLPPVVVNSSPEDQPPPAAG